MPESPVIAFSALYIAIFKTSPGRLPLDTSTHKACAFLAFMFGPVHIYVPEFGPFNFTPMTLCLISSACNCKDGLHQ